MLHLYYLEMAQQLLRKTSRFLFFFRKFSTKFSTTCFLNLYQKNPKIYWNSDFWKLLWTHEIAGSIIYFEVKENDVCMSFFLLFSFFLYLWLLKAFIIHYTFLCFTMITSYIIYTITYLYIFSPFLLMNSCLGNIQWSGLPSTGRKECRPYPCQ